MRCASGKSRRAASMRCCRPKPSSSGWHSQRPPGRLGWPRRAAFGYPASCAPGSARSATTRRRIWLARDTFRAAQRPRGRHPEPRPLRRRAARRWTMPSRRTSSDACALGHQTLCVHRASRVQPGRRWIRGRACSRAGLLLGVWSLPSLLYPIELTGEVVAALAELSLIAGAL